MLARARHVLARRPWLYWLIVVALGAGAALLTASALAGIDTARRAWGTTRAVVVATADLVPGQPLAGRTEVVARPAPTVANGALTAVPADAIARQHVLAGEVVVDADVAATGGPAALIPDGWRGVPVAEPVPSGATVGDRVSAVASGAVLAADGIVVAQAADTLVVAVPGAEAAAVAAASATGELVLLLVP